MSDSATPLGSRSVIDGQGEILTAEHVIAGGTSITITFPDGAKRAASAIPRGDASDIAVMRLNRARSRPTPR